MAVAMYFPMMKGGLAMLAHLLRADAVLGSFAPTPPLSLFLPSSSLHISKGIP